MKTPIATPTTKPVRPERTQLSLVHEAMGRMEKEDLAFFEKLIRSYMDEVYTLREAAWLLGNREMGLSYLNDPVNDPEYFEDVNTMMKIFLHGDWLGKFLHQVCFLYRNKPQPTFDPDFLLYLVEEELTQFRMGIDTAREVLQTSPEYVAEALRAVIKERPELLVDNGAR